ncbi:interleukin-17 receptor A-like [Sphaerodactylus townsendi]|uniref:interleukin-17 receptor A-like n=1 Tax=Sphaerodactylus townsendi TaxID=933632 RepID=UPI002026D57A|nr:interleukin-17 receptor A-like [Sphaerodactylus townsendi]
MHKSWIVFEEWTPSAPSSLEVHADVFSGEEGELLPVLNMQWKVATDASIQFLGGVELSVLQVNSNRQVCAQFDFQNKLPYQVRPDDGRPWNFSFNHFVVQPGLTYQVTVYHLPKLGTDGDQNSKSKPYTVPGCMDPAMKMTEPCLQRGKPHALDLDNPE